MIKTDDILMHELRGYASPKSKLTRMIKQGEVIQICRGVYITSLDDPRLPLAAMIQSPSYISFQTALSYYQLIPERTYSIMSAGFRLKKDKYFDTPVGRYSFHYLPDAAFPLALVPAKEDEYGFRLAAPEKALCDTLYKIRSISTIDAMETLLFEDLRMEKEDVLALDWKLLAQIAPVYRSTSLKTLLRWMKRNVS
ncbi:MAG: hypothetical protein HQ557_06620 [Bacteroidetes bacterium]|nr:hypothetical protein [Bacteroidota bacterium]